MNKLSKSILFLLIALLAPMALSAVELNWEHDYDKALETATKEKKFVYLFIGADGCKFCKKFKETTLQDKALIQDMKEDFVLVFISRDQDIVPDQFEEYGVPRHYFLNDKGNILDEEQGVLDVAQMRSVIQEILSKR